MHILFLSPHWPADIPLFVRGLAAAGAQVHGVGDQPATSLPADVRQNLVSYHRVNNIADHDSTFAELTKLPRPDRVIALWEPLMGLAARLGEHFGCDQMSVDVVAGFRDKALMTKRVIEAGLPAPQTIRATNLHQIQRAAHRLGFPVICKPTSGAGSADTFRVNNEQQLAQLLPLWKKYEEIVVEPFLVGPEFTYETLCVDGVPILESVCHYEPNTLIARQEEWISPIITTYQHTPRALTSGVALGRGVLQALSMGTGITHMEWFLTARGPMFGEVACRPPGANMVTLMNHAGHLDVGTLYGQAIVHKRVQPIPPRKMAAAIIFKRAQGQGRIYRVTGLSRFLSRYRPHVAECNLLRIGQHRRDWKSTFLSDGWVVVRHPDLRFVKHMAQQVAQHVHLYAR